MAIRMYLAALLAASAMWAASGAQAAVIFTVEASAGSGNSLSELEVGDVLTFDITLRNEGERVFGVGGGAFGYDTSMLRYVSGVSTSNVLREACVSAEQCYGGLDNVRHPSPIVLNVDPFGEYVYFLGAISLTPTTGTGELDPGVITGVAGDPQIRLVFEVTDTGDTLIQFGANPEFDGVVIEDDAGEVQLVTAENANRVLRVRSPSSPIPEPSGALLMAVGLASIDWVQRRRRKT